MREMAMKENTGVVPQTVEKRHHTPRLTNQQKISAITWAADNAGLSYGKYVQTLDDMGTMDVYKRYASHLKEAERLFEQRTRERQSSRPIGAVTIGFNQTINHTHRKLKKGPGKK
jgi:hypothetical protein